MNPLANSKYKILVVDDDVDLNITFALLLEFDGHEVRTAYNGEAALALLEKNKFDLIIMEYWLPRMKGDELAAIVKQRWPDQPIIIATNNMEEINMGDHPIAEADCLLNKPFSMSQLRDAIISVLDRYVENRQSGLETPEVHDGHLEKPEHTRTRSRPRGRLNL